jgi:hypothetical protein
MSRVQTDKEEQPIAFFRSKPRPPIRNRITRSYEAGNLPTVALAAIVPSATAACDGTSRGNGKPQPSIRIPAGRRRCLFAAVLFEVLRGSKRQYRGDHYRECGGVAAATHVLSHGFERWACLDLPAQIRKIDRAATEQFFLVNPTELSMDDPLLTNRGPAASRRQRGISSACRTEV